MPQLDELPIKSPESTVLNEGRGRIKGRNVDCFSSGALYIYLGTTDAIPIHSTGSILHQRPEFYEKRQETCCRDDLYEEKIERNETITSRPME